MRRAGKNGRDIAEDQQRADSHQHGPDGRFEGLAPFERMQQSAVENGTEQKDTRHQKDEDQHGRYLPTREDQAGGDARDRKNGAVRKIENAHDAIDHDSPKATSA